MGDAFMLHRVKTRIPKFTYTGNYQFVDDGSGNWRIKFLSSGTLTFTSLGNANKGIDVFIVGGGAGGAARALGSMYAHSGGGSGYVTTVKDGSIVPVKGTGYSITIGAGGKSNDSSGGTSPMDSYTQGANGGTSSAFNKTAAGGKYGKSATQNGAPYSLPDKVFATGGNGASGGGANAYASGSWPGGYNGSDGTAIDHGPGDSGATAGKGVGTNPGTSEFGEGVIFYARGGGSSTGNIANSGNGGRHNLNGSSGIVVIRNHR